MTYGTRDPLASYIALDYNLQTIEPASLIVWRALISQVLMIILS